MLDFTRTRVLDSREMPVAALNPFSTEGQAATHLIEGGLGKVQPSTGVANTIFAGFAMFQNTSATTSIFVETQTVPTSAPYTITLNLTPTSTADLLVKGTSVFTSGAVASGVYSLSGNVVTFDVSAAGQAITFTYRYALTVLQQSALYGDQPIGRTAAAVINAVGIVTKGEIYTDQFDTSADWSTAVLNTVVITAGANGRVYIGGSGASLGLFTRVLAVPTADYPFLGLAIGH